MPDATRLDRARPVAVIGAGPVGLAAAAHLLARGLRPLVLEAGPGPGHAVRQWGHVRMFSPWGFNTDPAARALLEATGWRMPDPDAYPTGADLVARYVEPLAAALAGAGADLRFGARVVGVSRRHHDRLHDGNRAAGHGREASPFVLHVAAPDGRIEEVEANAVIDASGTWTSPNPAGAHGLPAPGEAANTDRIAYGIPDVLGAARDAYAGAATLVLGGGHSAMNAVLDLAALAREAPGTRVLWAFRRPLAAVNFGGGAADGLAARGALGEQARALVEGGQVEALAPFLVHGVEAAGDGLIVHGERDGRTEAVRVGRMIVATGFRPDLSFLGELRLGLDPAVQATPALAPLIDPNVHSCGTVRPHGEAELRHPDEPGFYMAGMKAYGRAPTFLLATGHEQVRSIAAFLAGDVAAARRVELALPETGVCSTDRPASASSASVAPGAAAGCCGPRRAPEPAGAPTVEAPGRAGSCCTPKATA
jgi:FAD dependent oxidoreductase